MSAPAESSPPTGGIARVLRRLPSGETMPDGMYATRHHRITAAALAHVPFLLALGLFSGTMPLTEAQIPVTPTPLVLGEIGVLVGLALVARADRLPRRVQTGLSALAWMVSSMLLVQFSGGYIEAHFHFFVAVGVLASYEDWLPFALGLVYVVVGHGLFASIEASRVYNHAAATSNPWVWGLVHGVFVLMLAAAEVSNWQSVVASREESRRRLERVERQKAEMDSIEEAKARAQRKHEKVQTLTETLETKADEYTRQLRVAADGDLSVRLTPCAESEAMAAVARAVNEMLDDVEATVADVKRFAADVEEASIETTRRVESSRAETAAVASSVEEIAARADDQREQLERAAGEMNDLSATVEEIASSATNVAETAEATTTAADEGMAAVEETIQRTQQMETTVREAGETIAAADEQVAEIEEIVDMIGGIAAQTDMLAVNASIEAARAGGEDARGSDGFAVVASEVKELAQETQEAATEIEARIDEVQARTSEAVETVETAAASAREAGEAVETAGEQFAAVSERAGETNDGVSEISRATDDQAASAEETVTIVEQTLTTSRTTADEADEAVTATSRQAEAMQAVAGESETLATRAQELRDTLEEFTVSPERATDSRKADDSESGDGESMDSEGDGGGSADEDAVTALAGGDEHASVVTDGGDS